MTYILFVFFLFDRILNPLFIKFIVFIIERITDGFIFIINRIILTLKL